QSGHRLRRGDEFQFNFNGHNSLTPISYAFTSVSARRIRPAVCCPLTHSCRYLTAILGALTLLTVEKTCYVIKHCATHRISHSKIVLIPVLALRRQTEPSTIVP
ncbi:hypothetical protein ACTVM8_14580, partial [Serratia marcescens]